MNTFFPTPKIYFSLLSPRWRKVLGDLWSNKLRTILVVLSIGVGIFAMGTVTSLYIILLNDMNTDYHSINPQSVMIGTSGFTDDLLHSISRMEGVKDVEGRNFVSARASVSPDKWYTINITAIPPLDEMKINRLRSATLPAELNDHEILIERSTLPIFPVKQGDAVTVELRDGTKRLLRVADVVHDVSGFPGILLQQVNAYVNLSTAEWLGGGRTYDRVIFTLTEKQGDEAHIRAVTKSITDKLEKDGRPFFASIPPTLDKHPASSALEPLLVLMWIMGLLSVALSGFLVINTITALLAQHVRQIGLMKTLGALTLQIVAMYVILVMGFGMLALLVAVPAAMYMTNDLASGFANFFNFNLATTNGIRYPTESLILQIVLALLTPVLAAFAPVWSGTRVSVREALSEYGLGKGRFGRNRFDRALERINFFSRPILISIRNTFRRKTRLTITLLTLTLGGAIFLAILNFQGSLAIAIDEALGYLLTDVNVALGQSYRVEKITQIAMSSPDVAKVEAWGQLSAQLLSPDKKTNTQVLIFAPPNDSTLIKPVLQEGRWILPDDENAVVMGPQMIVKRPDLKVGDTVTLKINDKEYDFKIVGLYKLLGNVEPPVLYANSDYVSKIGGNVGRSPSFRIATHKHDDATQERVAKEMEAKLKEAGVQVSQVITGSYIVNVNNSINAYFVFFAMIMAVLSAVVGGLGLMGTMSMNVIERTREIGVMRALGASDLDVLKLVITEGMMIGILSWALGTLVGLPITYFFDVVIGYAFVRAPMPFVFSVWGCGVWGVVDLRSDHRRHRQRPARVERLALDRARRAGVRIKISHVMARSVFCDEAISKRDRDCFAKYARNDGLQGGTMNSNFESSLRPFFKNFLNPFMLLMWRLGLGPFVNASPHYGGRIMVLTHLGRKSGQLRRTPVNYTLANGELYCLAGFGSISDWYRNIHVNPNVEVWLPDGWWRGVAEEVSDDPSRLSLVRQLMIDSGFAAHAFGRIEPHKISDEELKQISVPYRLIHIKREEARTGREGPGDLSWVWIAATCALLFMLWRRKK